MISEERSGHVNKQTLNFPVGFLIRSPKKRLSKLGRKESNGSLQSNTSDSTVRSSESVCVRQPAKSKIRRHNNNRFSTVFSQSPNLRDGKRRGQTAGPSVADDPAELSSQSSVPGILKIFGSDICHGTHYKSVLATTQSNAKELVKEALERYCLEKEDCKNYVLCDVIGQTGEDNQWKRECFRVVGEGERPLVLQSLWKPKEGFSRRFEIQMRASVEEQSLKDRDTITAGINAQARKLQKSRSRVTSLFVDGSGEDADGLGLWRSLSEMDLSAMGTEARRSALREDPAALREDPTALREDPTALREDPTALREDPTALREDPTAEADKEEREKEETESSDDNSTQYSIHPPFDFPYFLLLQGYSHRQDFVIYLMSGTTTIFGCCREHSSGEDEERLKVDILLSAPDVRPQHCCVRRLDSGKTQTVLKPLHGAPVSRNGFPLKEEVELNPGDLVGLGKHYLFMFKDPTGAPAALHTPPWMSKLCPNSDSQSSCSSCAPSIPVTKPDRKSLPPCWRDSEGREASLSYELDQEHRVLQRIVDSADPSGSRPKLTPAFLLILCVRRSARAFQLRHLRRLLLRIANQIQLVMWEKTKELAAMQPETGGDERKPDSLQLLSTDQLMFGLQPLVLWMSNSIELLHFIQNQVPQLLPCRQEQQEQDGELQDSEMSSTRCACEEAMTVLEEVIMYSFQQCVYYLTKTMYPSLSSLLDGNPFTESGLLHVPEGLGGVLSVLKEALKLLTTFHVHADISLQLCAYLFFFINASLFNALMERGSVVGFYQWSRGVQIRANLDLLMDWIQSIGLNDLASEFFQKLSTAVNLLATPRETLLQASWSTLRVEFPALKPAQLHHMLTEYSAGKSCPAGWSPTAEEEEDAVRTGDVLESFDSHPPLILPSSSFLLDVMKPLMDACLFQQLSELQEFILHETRDGEKQASDGQPVAPRSVTVHLEPQRARGSHGDLSGCEAVLAQKLKSLELQNTLPGQEEQGGYHKSLALDPSCLLTPPNTPQGLELSELEASLQEGARRLRRGSAGGERKTEEEEEEVEKREEEETEEVFTVELHRGPRGMGLALVDGMKSPLRMSGIFVKSVVPDSPAARCQKLSTGDRILAVNGVSLVGMEYNTGRELIRSSGHALRLLVAKMDVSRTLTSTQC